MKETRILSQQDLSANMLDELRAGGWVFESVLPVKKEIVEIGYVYTREKC